MVVLFGVRTSQIMHASERCASRYGVPDVLTERACRGRRPCRLCASACLSCGDIVRRNRSSCHDLCDECEDTLVGGLPPRAADAATPTHVPCPCLSGRTLQLSARSVAAMEAARPRQVAQRDCRACPVTLAAEDALTLRCPHCGLVFAAFDGCCAITCACRRHFCALCLLPSPSSAAAHLHVQACNLNARGEYFVSQSEWEEAGRAVRSFRARRAFEALRREHGMWQAMALLQTLRGMGFRMRHTYFFRRYDFLYVQLLAFMILFAPRVSAVCVLVVVARTC